MIDFEEMIACTGDLKGRRFIGLSCVNGGVVIIYEDGATYYYDNDDLDSVQELSSHSKIDRIFYNYKDFSIAITDSKNNCNEKLQLILNEVEYIKNAIESNSTDFNNRDSVVKKIDNLGRITIPKAIRRQFKIEDGGAAKIYENNGKIIIEITKE